MLYAIILRLRSLVVLEFCSILQLISVNKNFSLSLVLKCSETDSIRKKHRIINLEFTEMEFNSKYERNLFS